MVKEKIKQNKLTDKKKREMKEEIKTNPDIKTKDVSMKYGISERQAMRHIAGIQGKKPTGRPLKEERIVDLSEKEEIKTEKIKNKELPPLTFERKEIPKDDKFYCAVCYRNNKIVEIQKHQVKCSICGGVLKWDN